METYPIIDGKKVDSTFAFEIENAYVSPGTIAKLLAEVDGVTDVCKRKPFIGSSDIHIEFNYLNQAYIVWEPWGDSSRYWIGPKKSEEVVIDIGKLEAALKNYHPTLLRSLIGDLLNLRIFKRLVG